MFPAAPRTNAASTASLGGVNAYLPSVGITAQNLGSGEYFEVTSVSGTGFTVTFRNDSAFVLIPKGEGKTEEKFIKTGLSDAINVEILLGLAEGDEVAEKPAKKIE